MDVMDILNEIYLFINELINSSSIYGILFACLLIFLESIIPVLPLFVFITIVFQAFGYAIGFVISYLLTCLGCVFAFFVCRTTLKKLFIKYIRRYKGFDNLMLHVDNMKLTSLATLMAIPFTPAFLINISASLSKMEFKKFLLALLIGKVSLVFFWGFIGTSLIESFKNPRILIVIVIMMLGAYWLSRYATKKLHID